MSPKIAVIIGGGPAGLTASYEFLKKSQIHPIVLEADYCLGGIARTVNHNGNRIDIGGHRFFSKSDTIMNWWLEILPLEKTDLKVEISYQNQTKQINNDNGGRDPEKNDDVMLLRKRLSRILFLKKFFNYPISLSIDTLKKLGFLRTIKIGFSYLYSRIFTIKPEKTLEDFFINRFGTELYRTFFKDYTEKVWGVKCNQIASEWGAQRIKGLSMKEAIKHAIKSLVKRGNNDIGQKGTETSLINQFLYPKFGPGQMWEKVGQKILEKGGEIRMNSRVIGIGFDGKNISYVDVENTKDGSVKRVFGDYFISSMPVKDLINIMKTNIPEDVKRVANGLLYRDFITVGILATAGSLSIKDNWIYIQEPHVKVGRIQIFNNWSPYLVSKPGTIWMGLEYFCSVGDGLWNMKDKELIDLAVKELKEIKILDDQEVIDSVVIRMEKTYPAYLGTHSEFKIVREFTDKINNLYLVGRNGMHRYNNQDHSMLTAISAVEHIITGNNEKSEIWNINTEEEYHEEKRK